MTFVGRRRAAPDYPYAEYDEKGDYNLDSEGKQRWPTVIEMLKELVADASRPAEERERAAEVLQFCADNLKYAVDHSNPEYSQERHESDLVAVKMMLLSYVNSLWHDPDDCVIRPASERARQILPLPVNVVSKRYHGHQPADDPIPAKTIPINISPEPVQEPAAAEEQEKHSLPFDERYSEAAIARQLAEIEANNEKLRRQRAQEQEAI